MALISSRTFGLQLLRKQCLMCCAELGKRSAAPAHLDCRCGVRFCDEECRDHFFHGGAWQAHAPLCRAAQATLALFRKKKFTVKPKDADAAALSAQVRALLAEFEQRCDTREQIVCHIVLAELATSAGAFTPFCSVVALVVSLDQRAALAFPLARALLDEASQRSPRSVQTARALTLLGSAYDSYGDFTTGLEHFEKAHAILAHAQSEQSLHAAHAFNDLGCALFRRDNFAVAAEHHARAQQIFERISDFLWAGRAARGCGLALQEQRRLPESMAAFEAAMAFFVRAGASPHEKGGIAFDMANVHLKRSEHRAALRNYEESKATAGGDVGRIAVCDQQCGIVLVLLGERDAALRSFETALAFFRSRPGYDENSSICLTEINKIKMVAAQQLPEGAERDAMLAAAHEALKEAGKLGADGVKGQITVLEMRGASLEVQGQFQAAIEVYERALAMCERAGLSTVQVSCAIASANMKLGRFDEAMPVFERVVAESTRDNRLIAMCLLSMGIICRQRNEFLKAKPHLERALRIVSVETPNDPMECTVAGHLAELYLLLDDCDRAIEFFERCRAIDKINRKTSDNWIYKARIEAAKEQRAASVAKNVFPRNEWLIATADETAAAATAAAQMRLTPSDEHHAESVNAAVAVLVADNDLHATAAAFRRLLLAARVFEDAKDVVGWTGLWLHVVDRLAFATDNVGAQALARGLLSHVRDVLEVRRDAAEALALVSQRTLEPASGVDRVHLLAARLLCAEGDAALRTDLSTALNVQLRRHLDRLVRAFRELAEALGRDAKLVVRFPRGDDHKSWRADVLTLLGCDAGVVASERPLADVFPRASAAVWSALEETQNYRLGDAGWLDQLTAAVDQLSLQLEVDVSAWQRSDGVRSVQESFPLAVQLKGEVHRFGAIAFLQQVSENVQELVDALLAEQHK